MAQEIKNTFLKSKMNKDLDDRILPNGEYRDARNISVGRSEDDDVGALENIIGNNLISSTDIGEGLDIIGIATQNAVDTIYVFLTDYTDLNPADPTNAPVGSEHYIYAYNTVSKTYRKLVQGEFLNFSTTNRIVGVNLIENLLFWTDNRNQPRKINVNLAKAFDTKDTLIAVDQQIDYYTKEHQISVAKYNPYPVIDLYARADLQIQSGATSTFFTVEGNRVNELSGMVGATVVCTETVPSILGTDYIKVESIDFQFSPTAGAFTKITVSPPIQAGSIPTGNMIVSLITSTMTNKNDDPTWAGDPDFLEDKFVRFSYRFKFDDNEYSLMAPFTQIAYIPKQNGYFVNGDENSAYQSTIVDFMENKVQNIGLVVPLPSSANRLSNDYKIKELEILFRESDSAAVKVITSIAVGEISGSSGRDNHYIYEYQSKKPYKTLPEAQTVRVYDKVPVRALAQESAGNRIIYGNYRDQHTPPSSINYNCRLSTKNDTGLFNSWVEYPNHSVKKNRNYQVGFVLADKFGRQSDVILSSNDNGTTEDNEFFSGSTIYSPYDVNQTDTNPYIWFGDVIEVLVNQPIVSSRNLSIGTPGLYAEKQQNSSSGEGFAIGSSYVGNVGESPITNTTFTFILDPTFQDNTNIPEEGDSMRGAYTDFVVVKNIDGPDLVGKYVVTTDGRVNDVYLRNINLPSGAPDLKFAYTINDLGWYSYKIVVKQTEQDYYNVYLPGILNGYPGQSDGGEENGPFPANEENLTAHTVLFNDNINKIPRDLSEVGPDQKQYRSSAVLYGVVTNTMEGVGNVPGTPYNTQYYPRLDYSGKNAVKHVATTIATARDLDMGYNQLSDNTGGGGQAHNGNLVYYQIDTNPLIARLSTTEKSIGWTNNNPSNTGEPFNMLPYLAVYETEPVESLLDLYWETSSAGLIVDLNAAVASTNGGVSGFSGLSWEFDESTANETPVTPGWFTPIDNLGQPFLTPIESAELVLVQNRVVPGGGDTPQDFTGSFRLETGAPQTANEGKFKIIYTDEGRVFVSNSIGRDVFTFTLNCVTSDGIESTVVLAGVEGGFGAFKNLAPSFDPFPDIVKSPDDFILISAADWAAKSPANGTTLNGQNQTQLKYSFEVLTTTSAPVPVDAEGNLIWTMNEDTGELRQSNTAAGQEATPYGIYRIKVILADAAGSGIPVEAPSGYGSLLAEENVKITIKPAAANPGALSQSCVIIPAPIPDNGFPGGDGQELVVDPTVPDGVFGHWFSSTIQTTACIYHITSSAIPLLYTWPGISAASSRNAIEGDFINKGITKSMPTSDTMFENTGVKKVGLDCHREGTLSFSINTYSPRNTNDLTRRNVFYVPRVDIYWRRESYYQANTVVTFDWQELPRRVDNFKEGNLVGRSPNDTGGEFNLETMTQGPTWDAPQIRSAARINTANEWQNVGPEDRLVVDSGINPVYVQLVRSVDFKDIPPYTSSSGAPLGLGVEYAVVVTRQNQLNGGYGPDGMCRTWLQVDDLNYPSCVPWLGKNAIEENGGVGNLFKYFRSVGSSNSNEYNVIPNPALPTSLYAASPYGDYVDVMYTDATNFEIFTPSEEAPYLGIRLDRDIIGLDSWTEWTAPLINNGQPQPPINEQYRNLQWSVGFDSVTGRKIPWPNVVVGVTAKRSLNEYLPKNGYPQGTSAIYGTLRIRKTTN